MLFCLDAEGNEKQSPKGWCVFCIVGPLLIFNVYIANLGLELLVVVELCRIGIGCLVELGRQIVEFGYEKLDEVSRVTTS